jgi:hypothetical protein
MRGCCSKPAKRSEAGRALDFWVDQGGHSRFWALSSEDSESESLPRTAHGVSLQAHRLERIEAAFDPIDISVARAAFFDLLAEGRVVAPEIDFAPLGLDTAFRRSTQ